MSGQLRFRWPDRPIEIRSLQMVREGEWLTMNKIDGHMVIITKDNGKITTFSRHNKPLAVSKSILTSLEAMSLEDGTVLHAEWTSRRESHKEEEIYLFSKVYENYTWLGSSTEEDRYNRLFDLKLPPMVNIVKARMSGYATHYRETVTDPRLEGIVLKKRDAKLLGGLNKSYDNPGFLKLKTRSGADGQFRDVVPDQNLVTMQ